MAKKRGKWANLKKSKNLKLRRDYINTHYINGMESITRDPKIEGQRALTSEEKDYLNTFYGGYVNASVKGNYLMETPEKNRVKITELKSEYDSLKDHVEKLDPIKDKVERNPLARRMVDIKTEITELDYEKDSYNRNNARNRCQLNLGKAINTLEFRTWEEFDQDTISDKEKESLRELSYEEKVRLFKYLDKTYSGMFTFDDINSLGLETIYELIRTTNLES